MERVKRGGRDPLGHVLSRGRIRRGLGNGLESFAREAFREGVGLAARTGSREDGGDRGSIRVPGSEPSAPAQVLLVSCPAPVRPRSHHRGRQLLRLQRHRHSTPLPGREHDRCGHRLYLLPRRGEGPGGLVCSLPSAWVLRRGRSPWPGWPGSPRWASQSWAASFSPHPGLGPLWGSDVDPSPACTCCCGFLAPALGGKN